jgi:hypothetical protein
MDGEDRVTEAELRLLQEVRGPWRPNNPEGQIKVDTEVSPDLRAHMDAQYLDRRD